MSIMVKKKYKLLNETFTLTFVDQVFDENGKWIYGVCTRSSSGNDIKISTLDDSGKPLSEDVLNTTIRHELFHFILDCLYFTEESGNETLVEWLTQATTALNKQGLSI